MPTPRFPRFPLLPFRAALFACITLAPAFAPAEPPAPVAIPAPNDRWAAFPRHAPAGEVDAPPVQWPARFGFPATGLQGICIDVDAPITPQGAQKSPFSPTRDDADPDGLALLKFLGKADPMPLLLEGAGSFHVRVPTPPPGAEIPRKSRNTAAMTFKFVSARPAEAGKPALALDRTWFLLYEPPQPPKAAILLMPGMVATPPGTLNSLTSALLRDGWAVLRMVSQPARFNEMVQFTLDPAADPDPQVAPLAELADQRSAEVAYAAEAAWAHVEKSRPEYAKLPKALVGFSAGAITAPAAMLRDPGRYRAALLVGGGVDLFLILEHCEFKDVTGVRLAWSTPPTRQDFERFSQSFLRASHLDGYHLAPAVKTTPSFIVMGDSDAAVPTPMGDLFWDRLGQPRRIVVPDGTHLAVFVALPREYDRLIAWLDQGIERR